MPVPGGRNSSSKSGRRKGSQPLAEEVTPNRRCLKLTGGDGGVVLGYRHVVLCGCVLSIYVYTALPSVPGGDSGELLAAGCQFGIPHPPGYPLINVLHFLTGQLPLPSISPPTGCGASSPSTIAWAANILSGMFGSGTAVLLCLATEEWTCGSSQAYNPGAAAAAAFLFCLSPLAWEYSTGLEVFALNNFLVAAVLYLTARIVRRSRMSLARVGAVVCGLGLSNQLASALVVGPLALCVLWTLAAESMLSWQSIVELAGLWAPLGLFPYAALVVSAQYPQQGSWGDLSSNRGFMRHILREEYGTWRLGIAAPNTESALARVREYLMDSSSQTMHLGPPLALVGVGWALAARRATGVAKQQKEATKMCAFGVGLTSAWAFCVVFWHGVLSNISLQHPMSRAVHARFWMQPNLLLCLAAGGGLGVVTNAATTVFWRWCPSFYPLSKRVVATALSLLLPLTITAATVWRQWGVMNRGVWSNQSHGWTMHLYGQALLSALPEGSILLSHTDLDLNAARYLRVCEGLREDVTHVSLQMMPYAWWNSVQAPLHPGIIFPPILEGVSTRRDSEGNAALVTRFLAANIQLGRPMFLDMQAVDERDISAAGSYRGFSLVPYGLVYRVVPKLTLQQSERWHDEVVLQLQSLDECMQPVSRNAYRPGTWEFAASSVYWDAHYQAGLFFLSYGIGMWVNTPGAEQRPHVLPALRDASNLLQQTLDAVDVHDTFSSPRLDLLKNTVLAKVRLLQALQAALIAASDGDRKGPNATVSPSLFKRLFSEMMLTKEQCLTLIPRFLLEAINDKDAEAFGKMYIKLREGV